MGVVKKQSIVPKELTTLFRAHDKRKRVICDTKKQFNSTENCFRISSLPDIPSPSIALQEVLFEYNFLTQINWTCKVGKILKPKRTKLKPINSFIAFRSFYSRTISNADYQRQLSKKLANLWVSEPNQDTWNQYAQSYNGYLLGPGLKTNFVDWLCGMLDIKSEPEIFNDVPAESFTNLLSGTIEDIYLSK